MLRSPLALLGSIATISAASYASEAESGGMPQLDSSTYPSQIFWLLLTFGVLYFLCARIFLPRIAGIIEERRNSIADDLDQASEFRREAEAAEAAYKQALADARARASQIAAETRGKLDEEIAMMTAETDAKLEADVSAAEARIAETAERAKASVREAAAETTKSLVAALIDETPSDEAIEVALAQISPQSS